MRCVLSCCFLPPFCFDAKPVDKITNGTGKLYTHRQCLDYLDHASLAVELIVCRSPHLGKMAATVGVGRWSLPCRMGMLVLTPPYSPTLTNVLQAIVLVQCIMNYLAVAHSHMGSGTEDYVENWMEVGFPVLPRILHVPRFSCSINRRCSIQARSCTSSVWACHDAQPHCSSATCLRTGSMRPLRPYFTILIMARTCGSCLAIALRDQLTAPWENLEPPVGKCTPVCMMKLTRCSSSAGS